MSARLVGHLCSGWQAPFARAVTQFFGDEDQPTVSRTYEGRWLCLFEASAGSGAGACGIARSPGPRCVGTKNRLSICPKRDLQVIAGMLFKLEIEGSTP